MIRTAGATEISTLRQAETVEEVEELWAPFKAKRQTRAQMAKDKGLEPLDPQMQFWSEKSAGKRPGFG